MHRSRTRFRYRLTQVEKYDEAIKQLYYHLTLSKKSIRTVERYLFILYDFIKTNNKLPEECTKQDLIKYFMEIMEKRDYHSTTMRGFMAGIKYYLKHIAERMDLFARIPNPPRKKYDIEVLTSREVKDILHNCKNLKESMIIQILFETGMRTSELINLNMTDINMDEQVLTIRNSKNQRTRILNFGSNLKETLQKYFDENPSLFSGTPHLRTYHPFLRASQSGIRHILKRVALRSGVLKRINVHSMRHTFAVHYLKFGGTIYKLKYLLGHKQMSTTFHYLQYAVLKDSKIVSPLDELKAEKEEMSPIRME